MDKKRKTLLDKIMKNKTLIKRYICPICRKIEIIYTSLEIERNVPCWECQRKEKNEKS